MSVTCPPRKMDTPKPRDSVARMRAPTRTHSGHTKGIEANPEKVWAVLDMASPKSPYDIHRLTGRLAALSRFLAQSGDKCHMFFKALKGGWEL
ncbi:hypothetical protein CRG98_034316 [Punica granatum]|uniref:Uncharacterized protein n=1 Tax=Punica granatum TaxID=22663 RepID=A0A2I0IMR3_PUNGR|nr:hypothetical protein CRG98_034316 [Punica granatum]